MNAKRYVDGKQTLIWSSEWQNIAFRVAVDYSENVNIENPDYLAQKFSQMNLDASKLFLDPEITAV